MTAWVELDQRCQEMGIHPDNLASKGGDAVFKNNTRAASTQCLHAEGIWGKLPEHLTI